MKKKPLLTVIFLFTLVWNCAWGQWTSLGSGITASQRVVGGIAPVNENIIWGFTWHASSFTPTPEITRTTDGGKTWHPGTLAGVSTEQFPIYLHPLDDQNAWLATADEQTPIQGKIYKTTDGGVSWVHQNTAFTGFNETPAGVYFWNENEGFAFGATASGNYNDQIAVYTTADGGDNWTKVTGPQMPAQLPGEGFGLWSFAGFFSVVGDTIWFGTTKNRIFKSADRGHSWQVFSTPIPGPNFLPSVGFRNSQNGLALAFNPLGLIRTTDGGQTWTKIPLTVPAGFRGAQVEYVPGTAGTWFMVCGPSNFLVSYDDGLTWEIFDSNIDVWSVEFLNPKTAFAGSHISSPTLGGVYKWSGNALGDRHFVNAAATGANTGDSWANAFTDLRNALAIAKESSQIWVAAGTYKPDTANGAAASTFLIRENLQLLGGFAGTETRADERDPAVHETILSGDLNGNDLPDDFSTNREDNVATVLTVGSNITHETWLDGLTISNGQADDDGVNPDPQRSGGGLHSIGSPKVSRCRFRQNHAAFYGGGAYFNYTGVQTLEIKDCLFAENNATRGAGLNIDNASSTVSDCTFLDNKTTQHGGGMRYGTVVDSQSVVVKNCFFEGNQSSFGGGLRLQSISNGNNFLVSGCSFTGNVAGPFQVGWGQGGGAFSLAFFPGSLNNVLSVKNCDYLQNTTTQSTGGLNILNAGVQSIINVDSCTFIRNESVFDGALSIFSDLEGDAAATVNHCLFDKNIAGYGGGLSSGTFNGGILDLAVSNSVFTQNEASEHAAVEVLSDVDSPFKARIENCSFVGNKSTVRSSALGFLPHSNDFEVRMNNCQVLHNEAPAGGAVDSYIYFDDVPFQDSAKIFIENTLFANNSGEAVFSQDEFGSLSLLNCTVAHNNANGILASNHSGIHLQNTILYNPGYTEFQEATSDIAFTSSGGNLIGDLSLDGQLPESDQQNLNPLFAGPDDYRLGSGSPCIDRGVDMGNLPEFDLDGNARVFGNAVDIGAYESPFFTSTREIAIGEVSVSPNPASDFIDFPLPTPFYQPIDLNFFDSRGRLVKRISAAAGQRVDVGNLTPGWYTVKVAADDRVYVGKFVKP